MSSNDDIKILEEIQGLLSSGRFEEAMVLVGRHPSFSQKFPVVKKQVSNKCEINIRDSVIENSSIVQNNIDAVKYEHRTFSFFSKMHFENLHNPTVIVGM